MEPITKQDLKEALEDVAKAKDLNELAGDLVRVEKKVDEIDGYLKQVPTRDEFPILLEKAFAFATLKAEHERMKKIIREKLGVEV